MDSAIRLLPRNGDSKAEHDEAEVRIPAFMITGRKTLTDAVPEEMASLGAVKQYVSTCLFATVPPTQRGIVSSK